MSDAQQWDRCSVWLGNRLNRDGDFAKNIVRDADAAGFTRAELAAAYIAIGAQTTTNDCWQLDATKCAYWRNHALLNNTPPAAASAVQGFSAADLVGAALRERARCEEITGSEAAKGHTALARHYAFKTGDTLADVVKALASMPLESSLPKVASPAPKLAAPPVASPPARIEETEADVIARIMNAEKMPALYAATPLPHADPSETVESVVARIMSAGK